MVQRTHLKKQMRDTPYTTRFFSLIVCGKLKTEAADLLCHAITHKNARAHTPTHAQKPAS